MLDAVGNIQNPGSSPTGSPPCLVFEWMDFTLAEVTSAHYKRNSSLIKGVARGVLHALATLEDQMLVHSDIKPDNILISNLDAQFLLVKVGDLGAAQSEGFNEYPLQPYAMRAPEVWQRIGCFHSSDIWSLAVTLFDWISPGVFGVADNEYGVWPGAWSVAKLLRLFPSLPPPIDPRSDEAAEFPLAKALEEGNDPTDPEVKIVKCLSFKDELKRMNISPEVENFLRYLFVVDYKKRPTATQVLHSPFYHALG